MIKQRHIRPGDGLHDDNVMVVRGGALDTAILRRDAERYHTVYAISGVSVFAARDVSVDELAQEPPLVRFSVLTLVRVGVLLAGGFRLEPTGRNPRHFTVTFDDIETGVDRACKAVSNSAGSTRTMRTEPDHGKRENG